MRSHLRPTDGPDAGRPLRLEPWQRGLLTAIDREHKPIVAVQAATQCGKTLLCLGVGLRAAVDGRGVLLASATDVSIRDLARRLDATLERAPDVAQHFPVYRPGPGSKASWKDRRLTTGGWIGMAASGSASQLASRTAAVAVADEVSRWPARVRSGEGHPLALLRARLADWGDRGRLLAISSPVLRNDAITLLYRDGDRRRLEYPCPDCSARFPFAWEYVTGRERHETPRLVCPACGVEHDERARRRMLRAARWVAQRDEPTDEDVISFHLSRLDSARSSLGQAVREWRRARRAVERGDREGLKVFRNVVLGLPGESGAADVDKLFEQRTRAPDVELEQVTAGVDVQADRLVFAVLGFTAGNAEVVVLDYGSMLGDPAGDDVWRVLDTRIRATRDAAPPVTCVSVDAGFSTSDVRRQCQARRWWLPTVGRSGDGKPIAKRPGATGICTLGKDDGCAWWSTRVVAGHVHLPPEITRSEVAEMCAAQALTAEAGALRWRAVESRPDHLWDAAILAVHARHFRPLARRRGPLRLVNI